MNVQIVMVSVIIAVIIGLLGFRIVLALLPRKLRAENAFQKQAMLRDAELKAKALISEDLQRVEVRLQTAREEQENAIADRTADLKLEEENIEEREKSYAHEDARVQKRAKEIEAMKQKSDLLKQEYLASVESLKLEHRRLQEKMAQIASSDLKTICTQLSDDTIQKKQVEVGKHLKLVAEEMQTNAQRLAARMLARTHARYSPEFIWPKGINHVEVLDQNTVELLQSESQTLLSNLSELSEGVNISLVIPEKPGQTPVIRLGGGYGIFKEAAKLTLDELITKHPNTWNRFKDLYDKNRRQLEQRAEQLGRQALSDLRIDNMHIEILKMVGALNWRTSYRQNQYYHSVEVAKLAGVLATELGVDPEQAKRCGLLHDIGKSIDYRIEGSHAVISGDYADRFGETKVVCDAVMSHHADLIVETPLAWVLQAADTLSGARPGARVNLEEGYQDRLSSIEDVVRSFQGVSKIEIMNGAREVHVEVNHKRVHENDLEKMSQDIARQIEEHVAYPGQIKILVTRRFESVAVA